MPSATYLVFGDLHGRVLPAFKLAQAWSREQGIPLAGLLQVGDLGDFPDPRRPARSNALEHGVGLIAQPTDVADAVFADTACLATMWFTAGNHEDYQLLRAREKKAGLTATSFPVDAYGKVRCLRDGHVADLPGGVRVGAVWGIDARTRRRIPPGARIAKRSTDALSAARFDVLLAHESPVNAVLADTGSDEIGALLRTAQPAFAFFGHYHSTGREITGDFGATRVFHLSHLELDSRAEEGSVGALTWDGSAGTFAYLDPAWLRTVTRHNWKHR